MIRWLKNIFGLLIAFCAIAAHAAGTTYYAVGGGNLVAASRYDWQHVSNWRLDSASSSTIPDTYPQEGDIVIFDKTINYMSVTNDQVVLPALQKLVFNKISTIHQGFVALKAGGDGLIVADGISASLIWWAGLRFDGTGEVPIYVTSDGDFRNQKGIKGTATLVKTGGGHLCTASEGKSVFEPAKTILRGGSIGVRAKDNCSGHEFYWDSNDSGLRLKLQRWYKDNAEKDDACWTIANGLFKENDVVNNTEHGITSDLSKPAYLILTGTPKAGEQRFTGQLYGTGGIAFEPTAKQSGGADFVFTIAKSHSTAGGGLKVKNGTLQLTEGATCQNLTEVVVNTGGVFRITSEGGAHSTAESLTVLDSGVLNLEEGAALSVIRAFRDGVKLANGTYTAANADWIQGAGSVTVAPIYCIDPIVLNVPADTTRTLDEALEVYNAAHPSDTPVTVATLNGGADKARTLVKDGDGTLSLTNAIKDYVGSFDVRGGIADCKCRYAFGNDAESMIVNVWSGATVVCAMINNVLTSINENRTFHIAGSGFNDMGALRTGTDRISWGQKGCFGKNIVLEDDARILVGQWFCVPNADGSITLNGHTLTFKAIGNSEVATLFPTVNGDGKIILDKVTSRGKVSFTSANAGNVVEMKNYGGWRFWHNAAFINGDGRAAWKFFFTGGTCYVYGDDRYVSREADYNTFFAPCEIDSGSMVEILTQNNTKGAWASFRNVVSGAGGFRLGGTLTEPKYLRLLNTANSFSGPVTVDRGIVYVYEPGTLPKTATLKLSRDNTHGNNNKESLLPAYYGAAFMSVAAQDLGACVLSGSYIGRVQGGIGTFTDITKSGSNTIEYFSGLGAKTLSVAAGTLKLPRGAAPGLWEGYADYADATAAAAAFASVAPEAKYVMRGPHTANWKANAETANMDHTESLTNRVIVYSGYIWNREASDANWTFVSSVNGPVQMKIDGETVIATTGADLKKVQKTITPGSHTFEYRSRYGMARATNWADNFGFAVNRSGLANPETNDCALCVDSGDGSLFTRSTSAADLPAFDAIYVKAGAKLDVNGNRYTAKNISGGGTVLSSATDASVDPALVVKSMTVNAGTNETLSCSVPVVLDAGFTVSLTNMANRTQKKFSVLSASAPITGMTGPMYFGADDNTSWVASLSEDGKRLEVKKSGFCIFLR